MSSVSITKPPRTHCPRADSPLASGKILISLPEMSIYLSYCINIQNFKLNCGNSMGITKLDIFSQIDKLWCEKVFHGVVPCGGKGVIVCGLFGGLSVGASLEVDDEHDYGEGHGGDDDPE